MKKTNVIMVLKKIAEGFDLAKVFCIAIVEIYQNV